MGITDLPYREGIHCCHVVFISKVDLIFLQTLAEAFRLQCPNFLEIGTKIQLVSGYNI